MLNDSHKVDAKKEILKQLLKWARGQMFEKNSGSKEIEKELELAGEKPEAKGEETPMMEASEEGESLKDYVKSEMKKSGRLRVSGKTSTIAAKPMSSKPAAKSAASPKKYG